jgi:hypothetical protein
MHTQCLERSWEDKGVASAYQHQDQRLEALELSERVWGMQFGREDGESLETGAGGNQVLDIEDQLIGPKEKRPKIGKSGKA